MNKEKMFCYGCDKLFDEAELDWEEVEEIDEDTHSEQFCPDCLNEIN